MNGAWYDFSSLTDAGRIYEELRRGDRVVLWADGMKFASRMTVETKAQ